MTQWKAKRFWSDVSVIREGAGFAIALDGRPVRTPGKSPLIVPTEGLGELLAEEWRAVGEVIDPTAMPATRMANSAVEKVAVQMDAVADHLAAYGETDLLCYRAERPEELAARQAEVWDPWLDWAADTLGVRLVATLGVVPVDQPPGALARLREEVGRFDPFGLAAFHDLVHLSGSLILGFAAARGAAPAADIWEASRLDELWQMAQWGADEEAVAAAARKEAAFVEAARFHGLAADRVA